MVDFTAAVIDPGFAAFGQAATYQNSAETESFAVKVIPRRPDEVVSVLGGSVVSSTALFEVRVSELPSPEKNGKIIFGAQIYIIQSPPQYADDLRLVWILNTYPQ